MATRVKLNANGQAEPLDWSAEWSDEGFRSYRAVFLVESDSRFDGPSTVSVTPGLPLPGARYLLGNDLDIWAWCRPTRRIAKHQDRGGDSNWWAVECQFSNRPADSRQGNQRDPAQPNDNPLLEPQRISISSIKDREQAFNDRFGRAILSSSHEPLRGPLLEFDIGRASIRIEQNVVNLEGDLIETLMNTVNDKPLWGLPKRCVKLSGYGAEKKFFQQFIPYWTRHFELETDRRTFDKFPADRGSRVLWGEYNAQTGLYETKTLNGVQPDPNNPQHFRAATDRTGQPINDLLLNGAGLPALTVTTLDSYSVSLVNGNINNPLSDSEKWAPLVGEGAGEPWAVDVQYYRGQVVTEAGATYIAVTDHVSEFAPPDPDLWLLLPSGVVPAGNYSAATTYSLGQRVRDTERTGVGYRKVEKYASANLLLLGIPVIL